MDRVGALVDQAPAGLDPDEEYGVIGVVVDPLEAPPLLEKRLLGPLAIGDVADEDEGAVLVPVNQGHGRDLDVHGRPVQLEMDLFVAGIRSRSTLTFWILSATVSRKSGWNWSMTGSSQQLLGRVGPKQAAGAGIDVGELAFGLDEDGVGGVLDEEAEPSPRSLGAPPRPASVP